MRRARRLLPVPLLLLLLLVTAGCAKSKPNESPAPAADPSASASAGATSANAPPRTPAPLLCSDGLHRRGDHWKVDCNPCRCAADGDIVCAHFPCASAVPTAAGPRDAAAP